MSIHIIKSKVESLGYMAYEPKYLQKAIYDNDTKEFIGWSKEIEGKSMLAVDRSLTGALSKAIERKYANHKTL